MVTAEAVQLRPLASLKAHPRNYRQHGPKQLEHITASLQEHGAYRPVVTAKDGTILVGHGVVQAARQAGLDVIPTLTLDLEPDDPRALKILVGDNEIGLLADIDDRVLSELLKEIHEADVLVGTGYDPQMLAALVMVTRPASEIQDQNAAAAWVGLPDYEETPTPFKVVVNCATEEDQRAFLVFAQVQADQCRHHGTVTSIWWPLRHRGNSGMFEG
jgi:hypothetical protein